MSLILWTNNYSVGVDVLDADHIMIFSLINHIDEAHQSGTDERAIGRILQVLMDRATAHFRREERLMEDHGYPDLEAHVAEHRRIMDELQRLHSAYQANPSAQVSREIVELLAEWLDGHVLKTDMRYRPYMGDADA
ncbi:MAG TPA: bacteriohemerythrin [Rhodospirillales bacterium]|jgi:hemerythrin